MEIEMTDQTTRLPIRRALISVSDKTEILEFARELEALGYREEKKIPEGKPMLEMSGDGRIRYNSDGDADGRVRVNTRWRIGDDTTVNAGGTKNVK